MYSHVHGVAGAIIITACPDKLVGGLLAYTSHMVLDYLGERGYGDIPTTLKFEGMFSLTFLTLAVISGQFWWYMLGWVLGNLPDIIDKPLHMIWGYNEWHSSHNGNGFFQWKGKKLGFPVKIQFDRDQTIMIGILSTLVLSVYTMILTWS